MTDVVETQKEEYSEAALLNSYCYNNVEKRRSFYGAPDITAASPNHVWRPLVEKAGYKVEDIPKTWDAYYDFFKDVQKKLRAQGVRNVYGLGFQVTTNGNDPNELFNYFLIAYGGQDIVTKDGKLHLDDPKVREAAIKALTYSFDRLQGRFRAAGGDQLERRRRQQRLPRQADRHGPRRHDLDRGRGAVTRQKERLRRYRDDGFAAQQRRQAGAEQSYQPQRPDPQGREECRSGQGFSQIFDPAEGRKRAAEDRARPQHSGDAVDRQKPTRGGPPTRTGRLTSSRDCSARPCRNFGPSTRPMPRFRTSTPGALRGSTSCRAGWRRRRRRRRRSSGSRRSSRNIRSRRAEAVTRHRSTVPSKKIGGVAGGSAGAKRGGAER